MKEKLVNIKVTSSAREAFNFVAFHTNKTQHESSERAALELKAVIEKKMHNPKRKTPIKKLKK